MTQQRSDGRIFAPEEVLRQRLEDEFFGLGERTPNRRLLKRSDRIVFYLGSPLKTFAATAVLATDSFRLNPEDVKKYAHGTKFYETEYGVRIAEIRVWEAQRLIETLLPDLQFIENKPFWMTYLQGGVRQISETDFRVITGEFERARSNQPTTPVNAESVSEFALEAHLEEFIDRNWDRINFGCALTRYEAEDQNGRQFPAGAWSIDFLCRDQTTGELVVVELKKGRSSDSTVGQLLRYMSWVRENVAEAGQGVREIIIAKDVDDALRYAVKELPGVSVLTYRVNFELAPISPRRESS